MKYSFVMPAYKAEFIRESIQSILNQTYQDFELIIVDDCSPQDIKSIVDEFSDSRIKYFRNKTNIGATDLVRQWNHSIEFASGKWIILATDDDVYDRKFLFSANSLLEKYSKADIFRARIYDFKNNVAEKWREEPPLPEFTSMEEYAYFRDRFLLGGIPQFVFRHSSLEKIGGFIKFPLAWYSDDATSIRMAFNGIVCSSEVLVYFRCSGLNLSSDGISLKEKIVSKFLFNEYFFNQILPAFKLRDQNQVQKYYEKKLQSLFPLAIKARLLADSYQLPLFERIHFIKLIDEHTPYLSKKDKFIMKMRLFIKYKW